MKQLEAKRLKDQIRARPESESEGNHGFTACGVSRRTQLQEKRKAIQEVPRGWNLPCTACGKPNYRGPDLRTATRSSGSCERLITRRLEANDLFEVAVQKYIATD
jgi:hypothetical protein